MAEPVLVIDVGVCTTSAALVTEDGPRILPYPPTGAPTWPSAVGLDGNQLVAGGAAQQRRRAAPHLYLAGPRQAMDAQTSVLLGDREFPATEAVAAGLRPIRAEAQRVWGRPVDRVTLTVPAGYGLADPRRDLMIAAGEAAGFLDVELVGAATAALMDDRASGRGHETLSFVCDLGANWTTSLVRLADGEASLLGYESAPAGQELDAMLVNEFRVHARDWLEPLLAAGGDGLRTYHEVIDFVVGLKQPLGDAAEVTGRLTALAPPFTLRRERLQRLAEPGLRWLVASCRSLLARVSAGGLGARVSGGWGGTGATLRDIDTVVLVGGASRLPGAAELLRTGLGRPVRHMVEPELAVLRGACRWVIRGTGPGGRRRLPALPPTCRVEPLTWAVPEGRARLHQWLVGPGEAYPAGAVLARVRSQYDLVFDLIAPRAGTLLRHTARPGDLVGPTLAAAASRTAHALAGDPPAKRHELSVTGEWLLTTDRRLLVECGQTGHYVSLRSIADGTVVRSLRPDFRGHRPHRGRVFAGPGGVLHLVAWDPGGSFSVWDIDSGRLTARFHDPAGPARVLVNEAEWRLTVEGEDTHSAGRYRRAVATIWDLRTGEPIDRLTDDIWQRRHPGYVDRSVAGGFGEVAASPDGRLRAVVVPASAGRHAVALRDAATEREVFRTQPHGHARSGAELVRTAFSADGRYLLANAESAGASQIEVWEI